MMGHRDPATDLYGYTWVHRNIDKPHRCPRCHACAIKGYLRITLAPRTLLYCGLCRTRWRYGRRSY